MGAHINIGLQGVVYFAAHRSAHDDDMLQLFSSKLVGVARGNVIFCLIETEKALIDVDSTFNALYPKLARDWNQQDDIVKPFYDRRCSLIESIWTFDLESDILQLDKKDCNLRVPLNLVRQRPIAISDFKPYEPPPILALQSVYPTSRWKMRRKQIDVQCLQRHKAFVTRILADFAFQWRHVLCGRYNNSTFRRLAYAIIRIVTLDFTVKEATSSRQGFGGVLIWLHNLPE